MDMHVIRCSVNTVVQAWIRGTIDFKLPLCAIRRDKTVVTVHTRWFFTAGETGIWKSIAIHARLIRGRRDRLR